MFGAAHAIEFEGTTMPSAGKGINARVMESLWVRLKAGGRVRPRDAQLLKRLGVSPFDGYGVYELDACGYVVAVGLPGSSERLDAGALLRDFEARFGIPATFSGPFSEESRIYGT